MISYRQIPEWAKNDASRYVIIDGDTWWTNGHIMIIVDDISGDEFGPAAEVLRQAEDIARERFLPGPAFVFVDGMSHEDIEGDDGIGGELRHYKVPMAPGVQAALCYVTMVEHLYGKVDWFGRGSFEPIVAKKDGASVAVLMPAPTILAYA